MPRPDSSTGCSVASLGRLLERSGAGANCQQGARFQRGRVCSSAVTSEGTALTPEHITAVIVTYRPGSGVREVVTAIQPQVSHVVVVDNGGDAETLDVLADLGVQVEANASNRGLAAAQNQGIEIARGLSAEAVLLLDHDSVAAPDLVAKLATVLVPGVGCAAADLDLGDAGRVARYLPAGRWQWRRVPVDRLAGRPVAFAIASGSLLRMTALTAVGPMREAFGIDYVDVDFSFRLADAGFATVVVPGARLTHRLGQPTRRLGVSLTNHAASRRFTVWRNRSTLWRERWRQYPGWVLFDVSAGVADLVRIALFEDASWEKLAAAWRGLSQSRS